MHFDNLNKDRNRQAYLSKINFILIYIFFSNKYNIRVDLLSLLVILF